MTGTILILSQLLSGVPMVFAQSTANATTKCDEGVHNFDPAASGGEKMGTAADPFINFPGESHCFANLTGSFPANQHVTPDASTHNPSSTNYTVPKARHEHHYINMSNDADGWYKRAWMKTFEINLQPDLLAVKKDHTLKCPIPDDHIGDHYDATYGTIGANFDLNFGNCDAGALPFHYENPTVFGGTSLDYNGTKLTYTFGLHQPVFENGNTHVKPIMPGINPGINYFFNGKNTTLWQNRAFSMTINFETKDMSPKTTWSATSTSRAEVIHTAIPKRAFDPINIHACGKPGYNASNAWCAVGGYNWVPVATVATVWKKPTPPGPATCTDLTLTPATLNDSSSGATTTLHAKIITDDGLSHVATLEWTPTGGTLSGPTSPATQPGSTNTTNFTNTYTLGDPNVGGSIKAKVKTIADGVLIPFGGNCDKGIERKTPPITPNCTSLSISPTGSFTEMDIPTTAPGKTITVTSSTKGGLNLSYRWESSTPELINFDGNPGTYIDPNKTTDLTRTGKITSPVTVTVTGVNASTTAQAFAPLCQRKITINPPPKPYCESVTLIPPKADVSNTGGDTVSFKVKYNDNKNRNTKVTWDPGTNLTLSPAGTEDTHSSVTNFAKNTNPITPGAPVSIKASVTQIDPNPDDTSGVDNSPACATGLSLFSGGGNQCFNLNNSGYTPPTIVGGADPVLLAPNPSNVTPPPPPNVTWTVSGQGWLVRNDLVPAPFNQDWMCPLTLSNTSVSLPRGCQYWYYTTGNPTDSGFVRIEANPNLGNVAACIQTTSFNNNTSGGSCTGLSWYPSGNQICVSPIGTFSGSYQWTIGGTTFTNGNCANVPPNTAASVQAIGASSACSINIPPQTNNNQCNSVTPVYNGTQLCLNVNGVYNGPFTWTIPGVNGGLPFPNGLCQNVPGDTTVNVQSPNPSCSLNNYKTPPTPPQFTKTVRAVNMPESAVGEKGGSVPLTLVPTIEDKIVQYNLTFKPTSITTTTITDDISKGYIQGKTNTGSDGGEIVYKGGSMHVFYTQSRTLVPQCGTGLSALKSECYSGDIGNLAGVTFLKISKWVSITYTGTVQGSLLTEANCKDNARAICQEKYPNTSSANYAVYPSVSTDIPSSTGLLGASAIVQSFCQYILSRAAGDIYLETDLNFGKDISICTQYRNTTGPIFTPGPETPPGAPSTGPGTVPIGHEVCKQGLTLTEGGTSVNLYGENAASKYLSSQICEVKLRPDQSWSKSQITTSIKENKTRVSRWEPNLNSGENTYSSFDAALPDTNVYHITNRDLTIGSGAVGADVVLHDGSGIGAGAKTFIIEGHDLHIKNNIKYGDCAAEQTCTVRDTASLAFIVLGGNVIIDPSVTEVSGVFFVQRDDATGKGGQLMSNGPDSFTKLTIYGSVYGDIQNLFTHHKFAGDPATNDGSVVIRFDERIILNTPPGLQDLLKVSQSEVAR